MTAGFGQLQKSNKLIANIEAGKARGKIRAFFIKNFAKLRGGARLRKTLFKAPAGLKHGSVKAPRS